MWKPTKEGMYRHGEGIAHVMYPGTISVSNEPTPRYCPDDFDSVATCPDDWRRWQGRLTPVPDGPWSIIAPDWQPGAPTVEQLIRWEWWAIWGGSGQMMVAGMVAELRLDYVLRSAPIQPDVSNGPLWVPLEVAK